MISTVPSSERWSVAMTKSTPAFRWKAKTTSTLSAWSRVRSVLTSFTGGAALRRVRLEPRQRLAEALVEIRGRRPAEHAARAPEVGSPLPSVVWQERVRPRLDAQLPARDTAGRPDELR